MTHHEMFEQTRKRLRRIWNDTEFNQAAWREACRDLWIILEREPLLLDEMVNSEP